MKKRCSKCKKEKELTEFGLKKYNTDGLNHYCKICENERAKKNYSNPVYRERKKYYQIKKLYGLSKEDYFEMLSNQNNKCSICGDGLLNDKNTHIDHSHTTGKIRGILCKKCNHILGNVNDDIQILLRMIKYLK